MKKEMKRKLIVWLLKQLGLDSKQIFIVTTWHKGTVKSVKPDLPPMRNGRSEPKKKSDYVYFIRNTETGKVKIGYSSNPKERLKALQTACHAPLDFLAIIPGDMSLEADLHRRFSSDRLIGEWFDSSPYLMEYVSAIKEQSS